jgi:hypothetical protein
MKGGSNNASPVIPVVTKKNTNSVKKYDIAEIFKLAYKLNRHRLVEKIIYNLSDGRKYAKVFGIKITSVTKGQQWFKYYGQIDNLVEYLNNYFFTDENDFTNKIINATNESQTFLASDNKDGVRHEMRILLLLLLFLSEKLDKILMTPIFFSHLKKSLEHIENSTGQSKIQRLVYTKLAILYFINQHRLLDKTTNAAFIKAINDKQTFQFASNKNTQSMINLLLGALERNQYAKEKIELERLKAEAETLENLRKIRSEHKRLRDELATFRPPSSQLTPL